jgi:hypothetical protein
MTIYKPSLTKCRFSSKQSLTATPWEAHPYLNMEALCNCLLLTKEEVLFSYTAAMGVKEKTT